MVSSHCNTIHYAVHRARHLSAFVGHSKYLDYVPTDGVCVAIINLTVITVHAISSCILQSAVHLQQMLVKSAALTASYQVDRVCNRVAHIMSHDRGDSLLISTGQLCIFALIRCPCSGNMQ